MTPELQRYYEQRLSMMGDPAWKDLMEDISEMLKSTNDISSINDEKTLHFRRGEVSMMRWLLSLKQVSEESFEGLQNDASI
jgi:hypothetical protein